MNGLSGSFISIYEQHSKELEQILNYGSDKLACKVEKLNCGRELINKTGYVAFTQNTELSEYQASSIEIGVTTTLSAPTAKTS